MKIDKALIFAAGHGKRMGEIGKRLPKVLWPIFSHSILEWQIAFMSSLGVQKIFINLHYMAEEIERHLKQSDFVKKLVESHSLQIHLLKENPEILLQGGGILNLKTVDELKGNLIFNASDQFLFLPRELIELALQKISSTPSALFAIPIKSASGYNSLEISKENYLKQIVLAKDQVPGETLCTYSGFGMANLDLLTYKPGPSHFFETIANFQKNSIPILQTQDHEYWDFGTTQRYWDSTFSLRKKAFCQSQMIRFLKTYEKIDLKESSAIGRINSHTQSQYKAIIIKSSKDTIIKGNGIYYEDLYEQVD